MGAGCWSKMSASHDRRHVQRDAASAAADIAAATATMNGRKRRTATFVDEPTTNNSSSGHSPTSTTTAAAGVNDNDKDDGTRIGNAAMAAVRATAITAAAANKCNTNNNAAPSTPPPPSHNKRRHRDGKQHHFVVNPFRRNHHNHKKKYEDSLFRVGSRASPASPTRASNYCHVHDAVNINFEEALSERLNGGSGHLSAGGMINNGCNGGNHNAAAGAAAVLLFPPGMPPLGVTGLRNLGNTCFLNSSLQCLSATIPLTDYFLGYDYRSEINRDNRLGTGGKLVTAYAELMKDMWLGGKRKQQRKNAAASAAATGCGNNTAVVKPTHFKAQLEKFAPQFAGCHQHDAQELLSFLLDGIHEDINRIKKKPYVEDSDCDGTNDEMDAIAAWRNYLRRDKSLIVDIFQGQLRNTLRCCSCGHVNIRFEPFMYLSLPMSADGSGTSVEDCLDLYLSKERLTGENRWYCRRCKTHRDAVKKTDLWIVPPILIVHLKRFKFNDYGRLMGSKNDAAVQYPVRNWDLSNRVCSRGSERPLYDLYAVSNHVGGLGGGHYTAHTLNRFDDCWYEFNDATVRQVDDSALRHHRGSAYLLFYNRTTVPIPAAATTTTVVDPESGNVVVVDPQQHQQQQQQQQQLDVRGVPLIRRQSVSRPDLWPHTQVQDHQFREFVRHSSRTILQSSSSSPSSPTTSTSASSSVITASTSTSYQQRLLPPPLLPPLHDNHHPASSSTAASSSSYSNDDGSSSCASGVAAATGNANNNSALFAPPVPTIARIDTSSYPPTIAENSEEQRQLDSEEY